ncbi:MAG: DUF2950 domain-containing protein [Phycisphaerales bacterium]|nr:MAG: DUF2950 domain-containing protein [Phycisphaerales bacterium]
MNARVRLLDTMGKAGMAMLVAAVLTGHAAISLAQEGTAQKTFATPEAASEALIKAFRGQNEEALLDIFGREHEELVVMTDKVAFRTALEELQRMAEEKLQWAEEGQDTRILTLGTEDWPFPIPLVREAGGWRFDTAAGAEEILNRRIGENELEAIANCKAYVGAQVDYARRDRDGDEVLEYAQRIMSTPGKKDGLYWEIEDDQEELSPFGPLLADAAAYLEAHAAGKSPYKGYYYNMLTRQGPNPPGGQYDYVINGNMIAGFALVACPADYGTSGVMTFMVSHHGKVYEKDLGEKTHEIVRAMSAFDPDDTWKAVQD